MNNEKKFTFLPENREIQKNGKPYIFLARNKPSSHLDYEDPISAKEADEAAKLIVKLLNQHHLRSTVDYTTEDKG